MTPEDKAIIRLSNKLKNTRSYLYDYYVKLPHIPVNHAYTRFQITSLLHNKHSNAIRHSTILSNSFHTYFPAPLLIYGYQ